MTPQNPQDDIPSPDDHAGAAPPDPASEPLEAPQDAPLIPSEAISAPETPGSRGLVELGRSAGETGLADPTSKVALLAKVPAEDIWLQSLQSERTRKAYQRDVRDFIEALEVHGRDELYAVTTAAVLEWMAQLKERGVKPATLRRKLSALSSLFSHLVEKQLVANNPVRDLKRPRVNRRQGKTAAFSQEQARALLDAPPTDGVGGLRDRAILSVGLQVGARRAEIAHMTVGDIHQHRGIAAAPDLGPRVPGISGALSC